MDAVAITDEVVVNASGREVWDVIADPSVHAEWHPFVESIDGEHAPGATRRCKVQVGKKAGETVERCTAYDDGQRIAWRIDEDSTGFLRLVSDWTAGFALEPAGAETTRVRAQSVFRPRNPLLVLAMPIVRRKFHQTQQAILAALQQSVEQPRARAAVEPETG
jgi:uncharacterized protein YndB with AHSA1/START domain